MRATPEEIMRLAQEAARQSNALAALAEAVDYKERAAAAPDPGHSDLARRLSRRADAAAFISGVLRSRAEAMAPDDH